MGRKGKDKDASDFAIPEIEDLTVFAEETRQYWLSLQPPFRQQDNWPPCTVAGHDEIDFLCVRKYGTSGVLVILLLIVWWRKALEGDDARGRKEWMAFVEDVAWVLRS